MLRAGDTVDGVEAQAVGRTIEIVERFAFSAVDRTHSPEASSTTNITMLRPTTCISGNAHNPYTRYEGCAMFVACRCRVAYRGIVHALLSEVRHSKGIIARFRRPRLRHFVQCLRPIDASELERVLNEHRSALAGDTQRVFRKRRSSRWT